MNTNNNNNNLNQTNALNPFLSQQQFQGGYYSSSEGEEENQPQGQNMATNLTSTLLGEKRRAEEGLESQPSESEEEVSEGKISEEENPIYNINANPLVPTVEARGTKRGTLQNFATPQEEESEEEAIISSLAKKNQPYKQTNPLLQIPLNQNILNQNVLARKRREEFENRIPTKRIIENFPPAQPITPLPILVGTKVPVKRVARNATVGFPFKVPIKILPRVNYSINYQGNPLLYQKKRIQENISELKGKASEEENEIEQAISKKQVVKQLIPLQQQQQQYSDLLSIGGVEPETGEFLPIHKIRTKTILPNSWQKIENKTNIYQVDPTFEPDSLKPRNRVLTRGDFGKYTMERDYVKNQGLYESLSQLLDFMNLSPACNPQARVEDLPASFRPIYESLPLSKKCLATAAYFSDYLLSKQTETREPFIKLPPYLEPESNYPIYEALNRLDKARLQLNRSRQMATSSQTKLAKAIKDNDNFQKNTAKGLMYSNNKTLPKEGKLSAIYQLYVAYTLIRDYEMNPLPPLTFDGKPNQDRIKEDEMYRFLMGTFRMEPNRLEIGSIARNIWKNYGYQDFNRYVPDNQQDNQYPPYFNVSSLDPNGPERFQSFLDYAKNYGIQSNTGSVSLTPKLTDVELDKRGFFRKSVMPDTAKALQNINQNFIPPLPIYNNQELLQWNNNTPLTEKPKLPPPTLINLPHASIDKPYNQDEWPFENIPFRQDISMPVYYPSGKPIFYLTPVQPPYIFVAPTPLFGIPIPERDKVWDARVAAGELKSHRGRLTEEAEKNSKQSVYTESNLLYDRNQNLPPSSSYVLWEKGKDFPTVNSKTPSSSDFKSIYGRNYYGQDKVPISYDYPNPTIINTPFNATIAKVDTMYPFGIPPKLLPVETDPPFLPETKEYQDNMLQHALFLLSAPLNQWQQNYINSRFWNKQSPEPNNTASPFYSSSAIGEGYFSRNNNGLPNYDESGWSNWKVPLNTVWVQGRNDTFSTNRNNNNIKNISYPIGPFALDPLFGTVGHSPSNNYHPENNALWQEDFNDIELEIPETIPRWIWVVRTNQKTVDGENTWGLDFYFEPQNQF